jgi:hypothetical protein
LAASSIALSQPAPRHFAFRNDEVVQMFTLRADCGSCCGLCCIVPDQLTDQGFRFDKAAESPCRHLDGLHRCSIHTTRSIRGYAPCTAFDCFGAGQWITQELFGGARWTDSADLARRMFAAYRQWLPRFEAAALFEAALPHVCEADADVFRAKISALTTVGTTETSGATDALRLRRETLAMIRLAVRSKGTVLPSLPSS